MSIEAPVTWYINFYKCDGCGCVWDDAWSCMCEDECPVCHLAFSPYKSDDLTRQLEPDDFDKAEGSLPMPLWPPAVARYVEARLERGYR